MFPNLDALFVIVEAPLYPLTKTNTKVLNNETEDIPHKLTFNFVIASILKSLNIICYFHRRL